MVDLPKKIELTDPKWHTINEVAERWGRSEDYVLHKIKTWDLNPSFYLCNTKCKYSLFMSDYEEIFATSDYNCAEISEFVSPIGGNWNNNPILITAKSKWTSDLSNCYFLGGPPHVDGIKLSADQEISEWTIIYSPLKPKIVGIDDLLIANEELQRFEAVELQKITAVKETTICNTEAAAKDKPIHPRLERTLLTIISGLLDVITGDYPNKEVVKHPSIKNQSDLILKLVELESDGLSKSNLEKYFALARNSVKS